MKSLIALALTGIVLAVVFMNCGRDPSARLDAGVIELGANLESLKAHIDAQAGAGYCESDSDCRSIGYGVRACGGPRQYLVYSVRDANEPELIKSIGLFNESEQRLNEASDAVGTCVALDPPLSHRCSSAKCEAVYAGGTRAH